MDVVVVVWQEAVPSVQDSLPVPTAEETPHPQEEEEGGRREGGGGRLRRKMREGGGRGEGAD